LGNKRHALLQAERELDSVLQGALGVCRLFFGSFFCFIVFSVRVGCRSIGIGIGTRAIA
jgi:hypothetical protein